MSRDVFVTDLRGVKRLRMSCQECGFALEMPIGTLTSQEYPFPRNCPGCKMPVNNAEKFQKDLGAFFTTIFNKDNLKGFDIFLEGEKGYAAAK